MTDWGLGEYEKTAARLMPAAEVAVAALGDLAGRRVLDVATGTGNAALLAARGGASAVGVDLAERLLEVARAAAAAESLDASFVAGDAAALPFEDDAFDAAVSVFGVIFADASTAARELVRVVKPGGRIVVTTWTTGGATPKVLDLVRRALDGPPPPPPRWSDPDVVRSLFSPHRVEIAEQRLPFTAASARAYLDEQFVSHPMWLAGQAAIEARGKTAEVREGALRIFEESNEDPDAFRTTSGYYVVTVDVR